MHRLWRLWACYKPSMCPHCGRDAPLLYRGALPTCSACGKIRPPLAGTAVHLTGKPSRIGGQVARVLGWLTLAFGSVIALFMGWLFAGIITATAGWVVGGGLFVITLAIALVLLLGGGALRDSGKRAEAKTFEKAVFALAEARGGQLSVLDVGQTLGMSDVEADNLLTDLAKSNPERVRVELDPNGTLVYQFPHHMIATAKTEYSQRAVDLAAIEEAAQAENPAMTKRSAR